MRLLAARSLGGAGHLNPLLPFLDAAASRGHEVLVVGPASMESSVRRAGHPFFPGGEPPEAQIAPIREQLPVRPAHEAALLANLELFGRLATGALLPAMKDAFDRWRPSLVLRDPAEYASAVVAADRSVPTAQVAISLAEVESGALEVARPALEEHWRGLTDAVRSSAYLTRFPASLDPSPFTVTRRVRVPIGHDTRPLPDWWHGRADPLVYVTFGTVLGYMSFAAEVFRTAVLAVRELEARVLITVGDQVDPATLGMVPDHVRIEAWVDQERTMGDAALVVCHGGSGTVLGALQSGVPIVTVPVFADQFTNGRRVAESGAGRDVVGDDAGGNRRQPVGPDAAARLTRAIEGVLADDGYRRAAQVLGAEMAAAPPVDDVVEELVVGAIGP